MLTIYNNKLIGESNYTISGTSSIARSQLRTYQKLNACQENQLASS